MQHSGRDGRPVSGEHRTVIELLRASAAQYGEHVAFVDRGANVRLTFADWNTRADTVAAWLRSLGVGRGDVVCLVLPSSADYAIAYHGAMRIGAITSGVNPRLGASERASIFARTNPKVTIADPNVVDLASIRALISSTAVLCERSEFASIASAPSPPAERFPTINATDIACIVWTSGTTGVPKGAVFDHECFRAMADAAGGLTAAFDRKLSPLPFAHVGYMTRPWDEIANVVTTVISPTPWTAGETLQLLEEERLTLCQGVPTQYRMLLDHPKFDSTDLSSLRLVGMGAARIPPELVREARECFAAPVMVRYASTESSVCTGTWLSDDDLTIATTVGRPGNGVSLIVADDDGNPCAVGEVGTVRVRSRAMMRGYWGDQAKTDEVLTRDGWLVTGDLGRLDQRGVLELVGRRTEMYIRGGYNVYPGEVENVLGEHPDVVAVAITGVADATMGEVGVAWVVLADTLSHGARSPRNEMPLRKGDGGLCDHLRAYVKESLSDYKAPDVVIVVDALPLTSMSKVDKRALVQRWSDIGITNG